MSSSAHFGQRSDSTNSMESVERIRATSKMALKHKTIARIETHNVTVVRTAGTPVNLWCEACGTTTRMVTPEHAADMLKTNPRAIYQHVEKGEVHFVQTGGGEIFICCSSLLGETSLNARSFGGAECP